MQILHIFTFLFVLLISGPVFAQDEKVFNAESFTLENGLRVVVIPNHRAPVVTHMVWYRVGSADELPGETGLAHFLEHLMFKGSPNVAPGEFSKAVRRKGGKDNAFTSHDFTAYYQSVAKHALPEMMEMEADRMQGLLLPEDAIISERNVVLEERRQRTENDPRNFFQEQMQSIMFINHPYGNPVIGWFNEIDTLDEGPLRKFYKKWYGPNNAIMVVSGDMTAEELKPLAEKYYGHIPPLDTVPERNWTNVPPLIATPKLVMENDRIEQPMYRRMFRVPSHRQNKEESNALAVLEDILGGGVSARLYKNIVVRDKLATSVSFSYYGTAWSDSLLYIGASPKDGVSMTEIESAIEKEVLDVIENGVTEEELKISKQRMIDSAVFARDSLRGPAMIVGRALITGATLDDIEYWPKHVNAVTAEQVQQVAAKYLDHRDYGRRPYVTGHILPKNKAGVN